jgi:hypothetical protein
MNPMTYDAEVEEFIAGAAAAWREALEAQAKWLKAQRGQVHPGGDAMTASHCNCPTNTAGQKQHDFKCPFYRYARRGPPPTGEDPKDARASLDLPGDDQEEEATP